MAQQQIWQWSTRTTLLASGSEKVFYDVLKRSMDILLATALIILLLPLLLLIALLIKLDSPGPVIFTQERVGAKRQKLGRQRVWLVQNFKFYKFRSMVQDADPSLHEAYIKDFVEGRAQPTPESGGKFKLTNDPRVTRVGCFLQKFSLDELPQLFNVLKGDMSVVGPRAVPTYEVAGYRPRHHHRFAAMPGITGYWGMNYVRIFNELTESRVVAVCEQCPERLKEVARRFPNVYLTTQIEDVISQPDVQAVIVCTEATSHYNVTRRLLLAGKHVLVEKPLTTTSSDAQKLIELADSQSATLMVGHTFIFNAGVRKVKEYVQQDSGRVYYLYARRTNLGPIRRDVNALWDLAPHDIAIFNYLLNSTPEWVSAIGGKVLGNSRDDVG